MRPLKSVTSPVVRPLANDQLHFRVIFHHRICDVMQQRRFPGSRWSDDEAALSHPQRRHQIHDPRGVTSGTVSSLIFCWD